MIGLRSYQDIPGPEEHPFRVDRCQDCGEELQGYKGVKFCPNCNPPDYEMEEDRG